jgi:hypothetical protein
MRIALREIIIYVKPRGSLNSLRYVKAFYDIHLSVRAKAAAQYCSRLQGTPNHI